ncbi:MAG TPA: hypothetical protein VMS60_04500 [Solirubrobacterales bacterium]|nr:hypothetical protein [Solirubrobacterales bacterium]
MEASERDSTQDWLVPADAAPPLLRELELKADQALAIARASEEAVGAVGEVALDAARQARRAAELAETASVAALEASRAAAERVAAAPEPEVSAGIAGGRREGNGHGAPRPEQGTTEPFRRIDPDDSLRRFNERADRVAARLLALSAD